MGITVLGLERAIRPDGPDSWPSSLNKAEGSCSWPEESPRIELKKSDATHDAKSHMPVPRIRRHRCEYAPPQSPHTLLK
jgi:hypothetical protein